MSEYKGSFFKKLVGKSPSELNSMAEIEASVEKATGKKLSVCFYPSDLISPRGSVFPVTSTNDMDIEGSFFHL